MKAARRKFRPVSADEIAKRADGGEDISSFFTNKGKVMRPKSFNPDPAEKRMKQQEEKESADNR
jgi:hypothetical protein